MLQRGTTFCIIIGNRKSLFLGDASLELPASSKLNPLVILVSQIYNIIVSILKYGYFVFMQEISHATTYDSFSKVWSDDPRFEALERKDRESLLNDRFVDFLLYPWSIWSLCFTLEKFLPIE